MFQIGEIVEIITKGMFYSSAGVIVNLSPMQCRLISGAIVNVENLKIEKLRNEVIEVIKEEFE